MSASIYDNLAQYYRAQYAFHRTTVDKVTEIAGLKPGQRVLDLGCGVGLFCAQAVQAVGPTGLVVGVDWSSVSLDRAKRNAPGVVTVQCDIASKDLVKTVHDALQKLDPSKKEQQFDVVVCVYALTHVIQSRDAIFNRVRRFLGPESVFIYDQQQIDHKYNVRVAAFEAFAVHLTEVERMRFDPRYSVDYPAAAIGSTHIRLWLLDNDNSFETIIRPMLEAVATKVASDTGYKLLKIHDIGAALDPSQCSHKYGATLRTAAEVLWSSAGEVSLRTEAGVVNYTKAQRKRQMTDAFLESYRQKVVTDWSNGSVDVPDFPFKDPRMLMQPFKGHICAAVLVVYRKA